MQRNHRLTSWLSRVALVAALMIGQSGAAQAQNAASSILQLVAAGDFDGARRELAATPHSPIDELFLEAQILVRQGRPEDAVSIYRAVLAAQPGLIPIRQLLAKTLLEMGDFEAARFHFRTLLETDTRNGVQQQYAAALRLIQQKIPSGISASFSIIPSSNINRGTTNSIIQTGLGPFQISPSSREQSGVGLQFGLTGFLRVPQGEAGLLTFSASAFQTFYSKSEFNVLQPSLSASYQSTSATGIWSIEAFARRAFRDVGSDYTTLGLQYSGRRKLSGPNVLTYSVLGQDVQYDTDPALSGPTINFDLGLQRQITPTTAISGGVRVGRGLPEVDHLKYRSASIYGGISRNWNGGWATFTGVEVGTRWYDSNFTALPFKRDDQFMVLTGTVLNSTFSWQGFSPRVSCSVQKNVSNVAFYDYTATECNIQMTRDF